MLDRSVADFIIDHKEALIEFENVSCSDEHAFGTIMGLYHYDMRKVKCEKATWTRWHGGAHPETIERLDTPLIDEFKRFGGFFARKFSKKCLVSGMLPIR
jgi:hypothetical protein